MRKHFALMMIVTGACFGVFAQETMEKAMEKRAREMHRVIGLNDKEQWKKFVRENYSQALIDRTMQEKISTSEQGTVASSSSEIKESNNIEAKAKMFERLHSDFGASKIISIKATGEKMVMVVQGETGLNASFQLKFQKTSPYLMEGLGIEVVGEP